MHFSKYFVLAAAVVSIAFAQESGAGAGDTNYKLKYDTLKVIANCTKENLDANVFPNATLVLDKGHMSAVNILSGAEYLIRNGISKAKNIVLQNPEAAKELLHQAFVDSHTTIINYASTTAAIYGVALALSIEGAREGLESALLSAQTAGFTPISTLIAAENLLNRGIDAGGPATLVLLDAAQLAIDTGFVIAYSNMEFSIRKSVKALRDAKNNPKQEPAKNPDCESAEHDADTLDAIAKIGDAAEESLQRGANAVIIRELANAVQCAIRSVANIVDNAIRETNNLLIPLAEENPSEAQINSLKIIDSGVGQLYRIAGKIYVSFGEAGFKSRNHPNNKIAPAIVSLAAGEAGVVLALNSANELVSLGIGHPADSPASTLAAAIKIGVYIKVSLIKAIVKSAKLAFSVI